MESICDALATVKVDFHNVPVELLGNILGQFVDDITSYLNDAWGLTMDEFSVVVDSLDEDVIILA